MRKTILLLVSIVGLIVAAPASADSTLGAWWHFNEGSGTVANDSSTNANNGTVSGAPQWVNGVWGSALRLDGSSGPVRVPDSASLEPASGVSVTAWVKALAPGNYKYIVAK